jgi:hypothetical protein
MKRSDCMRMVLAVCTVFAIRPGRALAETIQL